MVAPADTAPPPDPDAATLRAPQSPAGSPASSPLVPDAKCPVPLSDREKHLLFTFIACRYSLPDLIEKAALTPDELIAFQSSPAIAAHLAATQSFTTNSLILRATEARRAAIDILEETARKLDDPVEKRRAAASLLRATSAPIIPAYRSPSASSAPDRAQGDPLRTPHQASRRLAPPDPSPAYAPRPDLTSRQVAEIIAEAVRFPDRPDAHTGHATIAAFTTTNTTVNNIPIPADPDTAIEVLRFAHLKSCTVSTGASAPDRGQFTTSPDGVETALHTIQVQTGPRSTAIRIRLTRTPTSTAPNCWLLSELHTAPVERPP